MHNITHILHTLYGMHVQEAMQLRVDDRTARVETKAGQVSIFLVKAEKAIAAKAPYIHMCNRYQ